MAKPWNVIWVLVDSVRNYRGAGDDRDKLEIMDRFSKEAASFSKAVTSAPSTVMSVAAMMTSRPAYSIARDYDNFKHDPSDFMSLRDILRMNGYDNFAILCYRATREKFVNLFDQVPRKYWPRGLKHSRHAWSNDDINVILTRIMDERFSEPVFLYLHYNCRGDFRTSEKVEWAVDQFRSIGLFDRSVVVMCSDHGYPDPNRGITPQWFKERSLTHDMFVTDDNILVPLYIGFPGVKAKTIDTVVSTLDIAPTILDVLGIIPPKKFAAKMQGRSLMPLISGDCTSYKSRLVRVDSRFLMQSHRITALRGDRYKLTIERDTGRMAFFDLQVDPHEDKNCADSAKYATILQKYQTELDQLEQAALKEHLDILVRKAEETLGRWNTAKVSNLLLIDSCIAQQRDMVQQVLRSIFQATSFDLVTPRVGQGFSSGEYLQIWQPPSGKLDKTGRREIELSIGNRRYDVVFVLTNSPGSFEHARIMRWASRFTNGAILQLDPNMDGGHKWQRSWNYPLTVLLTTRQFYLHEPSLLFEDVWGLVFSTANRIRRRFARQCGNRGRGTPPPSHPR